MVLLRQTLNARHKSSTLKDGSSRGGVIHVMINEKEIAVSSSPASPSAADDKVTALAVSSAVAMRQARNAYEWIFMIVGGGGEYDLIDFFDFANYESPCGGWNELN